MIVAITITVWVALAILVVALLNLGADRHERTLWQRRARWN
jgi:hypothetical protein